MKSLLRRSTSVAACAVLALGLTACSSPEEKVAGFNRRAEAFLQKGDVVNARAGQTPSRKLLERHLEDALAGIVALEFGPRRGR